jgi:hypothetical protein
MRKTLSFQPNAAPTDGNNNLGDAEDISDILNRRPKIHEPSAASASEVKPEQTVVREEPQPTKKEVEEEPEFLDAEEVKEDVPPMFDSQGFAKTIVGLANFGREWFYPGIYDKIVFNEFERADLRDIQRRQQAAKKKGEELTLMGWEADLIEKNEKLVKAKLKISFSEKEQSMIANKLARHLEKIDFMRKLEEYDWILILLTLEGLRFMDLKKIKNSDNA